MTKKSSRRVFCLSVLVAGFFFAAPSGWRPALDTPFSAHLSRVEEGSNPAVELKSEQRTVSSEPPGYAKGVTAESSPILNIPSPKPVFEKDRRQAVLSLISYPWQDLGYNIVFMGSRIGYRAMTLTAQRRIEVYVRPGEGLMHQAYDLAHELGHAFDLKYNSKERRRKWCELRGIDPSTPWFGCDACPDYNTPAGDFAETFAYLLLGPGNYHSLIAPAPKIDQLSELAAFCQIENLSGAFTARMAGKRAPQAAKAAKTADAIPEPKAEAPVLTFEETVESHAAQPESTPETNENPVEETSVETEIPSNDARTVPDGARKEEPAQPEPPDLIPDI